MKANIVFKGATVLDGSGGDPFIADVAITGDRISAIESRLDTDGAEVIDAQGLVLSPGFIDSHTHDDGYLLAHPDMKPKVSQGITTVVTGNCGISLAPLGHNAVPQPLDLLGPASLFRFPTFQAWMEELDSSPAAVNVIPLVGHTTLRVAAMTELDRAATAGEVAQMRDMLQEALDAGAFGVSTGTFYPPAAAAPTEEIIEICQPLKACRGIYATHLRDEADHIVPAIEEALRIGRETESRVVFSHHKLAGERNHGRSRETLDIITRAAESQPVCLDCHPYPATSTMLRLDRIRIASRSMITWCTRYPEMAGRDFDSVMEEWGLSDEETLERLQPAGAIYFLMDEADVERIFEHPLTMVGSDGLPFDSHPHPRQWGTFPRVLRAMVREQNLLSLPQAIHRMTGLAADQYGLRERGRIKPGYFADLVLFDPETISDKATFSEPVQASVGIASVWVNGEVVWDGRETSESRPGRVLRRAEPRVQGATL